MKSNSKRKGNTIKYAYTDIKTERKTRVGGFYSL